MTETIVVAYRPIGFNYHHKYIIYNSVNSDGLTTAYYGAGGPDAYFDLSNEGNTAYGAIDTYTGEYSPILENDYDNPDYTDQTHPSEVIIEGDDLGAYWDLIVEAMDLIKAANTAYFPTGPNSNSVVDTAISYAGLPEPTRDSGDPNRPGRSHADYVSPGSGTMLPLEPSPPPPEPPPSGYYSPSWFFPPEGPLAGSEAAISPLVLDLDGDGIELTELGATATWFDLDADGFGERTGWVAPDDALLALDRDGNGTIDDITELFGNATTNGFIELADLDSDASGTIDLFDAQWHNLRLWIDADSDGISDDGELHTLDAFGIVSLSLAYQPDGFTVMDKQGLL